MKKYSIPKSAKILGLPLHYLDRLIKDGRLMAKRSWLNIPYLTEDEIEMLKKCSWPGPGGISK